MSMCPACGTENLALARARPVFEELRWLRELDRARDVADRLRPPAGSPRT